MPHHPSTCCEVEEPVAGLNIALQDMFLLVLQERANGAVNNTFWRTCRTRRVEDVHRMICRKLLESELFLLPCHKVFAFSSAVVPSRFFPNSKQACAKMYAHPRCLPPDPYLCAASYADLGFRCRKLVSASKCELSGFLGS